ncbi:MAG: response regulator transcription factor [Phycisphaerae bacterium]|nr:response regulator transcription factor [Phycisphaerae bacterium]
MGSTRIIIADDHTIVRHGLVKLLQQEEDMEVIAQADNGMSTVDLARTLSPDAVVMDVGMPDLNGIGATEQILRDQPNIRILALSMHSGKRFVVSMLKAGAAGYLLKDCALEELVTAIRTIVSGKTYLSPSIADIVVENCIRKAPETEPSAFSILSQREREVLQLLAEGNTTKQIALTLHISPKTVEGHRLHIMGKLNIDNVAQLTKYAIQEGLTSLEI